MAKLTTPVCEFGTLAHPFNLKSVDGQWYSLEKCRGENGVVIVFMCNHCPYVKAILPRWVDDAKSLQSLGFGVVAIAPNDTIAYPEDNYENMQKLSLQYQFPFPYLIDESQDIAKAYGAVCTPDFFGYNSDLKLQYRGRLDASGIQPAPASEPRELVEAMKQVLETGQGPQKQIASQGCSIKWRAG